MQPLTPEEQKDVQQVWDRVRELSADTSQPDMATLAKAALLNAEAVDRLRDLLNGHFMALPR